MATRTQRIKVGAFLFIGGAAIAIAALAMSGFERKPQTPYWMEFRESVLGLNVGGVVEYLGAPVGQVTGIRVTTENSVRVDISVIDETVTLREGVQARLVPYSLVTGTMSVSLSGGDPAALPLPAHAQIPTEPALFSSLVTAFNEMQDEVKSILGHISTGLEGMEEGDIARLLKHSEQFVLDLNELILVTTDTVETIGGQLEASIVDARAVTADVSAAASSVNDFFTEARAKIEPLDAEAMSAELNALLKNLSATTEKLNTAVDAAMSSVDAVTYETDNLEQNVRDTLRTLNDTLESLRDLADTLRQDPQSVIRGRGEPRGRQ